MDISLSVKYALVKTNKKSKELAKGINVTGPYVSAISNGHKQAGIDFIVKCALFFDMKVSEFIALGEE